jgi:streptogramin lyase
LASVSTSPAPVTLASTLSAAIGVFGQRLLFFLPQGDVDSVSLPPESNSPVTTLGTSAAGPADVMPCGTDACWLGEGAEALMRIDPAGGPIAVIPLPSGLTSPLDVAFDGVDFYIIDGESGTTERLGIMAADGSSFAIIATMSSTGGGSVAVDDECVYWSNALGIFSLAKTAEGPFAQ